MMRSIFLSVILGMLFSTMLLAQSERKFVRRGNRAFDKDDYIESEIQYRKALEKNVHSFKGKFNLADALYKQNKFEEALETLDNINQSALTAEQRAMVYHNRGNTLLKMNKLNESIEAYKKALRLNPDDYETKYNLSQAIRQLKENKKNQDKNKNKEKDRNKNKNKDKDKDKNKKQNKDKKDKDNKNNDKNREKKDKDRKQDKRNEKQPREPKLSKNDAERILQALQNNEKKIQERLKKRKAKAARIRVSKNW